MNITVNNYEISLEFGINGTTASAMVQTSTGEYRWHRLYIDNSIDEIIESAAQEIDDLSAF